MRTIIIGVDNIKKSIEKITGMLENKKNEVKRYDDIKIDEYLFKRPCEQFLVYLDMWIKKITNPNNYDSVFIELQDNSLKIKYDPSDIDLLNDLENKFYSLIKMYNDLFYIPVIDGINTIVYNKKDVNTLVSCLIQIMESLELILKVIKNDINNIKEQLANNTNIVIVSN